ncbi:MAG: UDP-N-acetylmuramate--L-alanine ligase, partial [candidate division Zixibacteria bacterium]|nr:UDP-N-acetylmuramate--L-alanine ligase [candidate division Zixibacteria bacterium]
IMIVDDYAHHPTEIKATLLAARNGWNRRVVAVFQPHLYSRTRDFYPDFGKAFANADILILTDIYPAREEPIAGISSELILQEAKKAGHNHVYLQSDKKHLLEFLLKTVQKDDIVITLGAGDITKLSDQLVEAL